MNPLLLILLLGLAGHAPAAVRTDSPAGRWKTIDEDTGVAQSIVEIYPEGDAYSGKIAEILTGNTDARCVECDGKQKNKPLIGLVIIKDLQANTNDRSTWDEGSILDPQSGKTYKLSAWYEDDNPDVLYIRGKHWTGLYRTQQWVRE